MNFAFDLFLLMFNLSQLHDKANVIKLFVGGLQEVFRDAVFTYNPNTLPENDGYINIRTRKSNFGSIKIEVISALSNEEALIISNAVQMLAVILERLAFDQQLVNEKNSFAQIAEERLSALQTSIKELESARSASLNLIEDLSEEIEKRKIAEQETRISEEKYRSITENSFEMIALLDLQGHYLFCNNAYLHILGYHPSELINTTAFDLIHPDEKKFATEEFFQSTLTMAESDGINLRLICKNGSTKWVAHKAKLLLDQQQKPDRVLLIAQDITDRKIAEEKVKILTRSIEESPVSIVITKADGSIEYVNPKFSEVSGYTFEEVIGANPRVLKSGERKPDEYRIMWDTLLAGKEWRGEFHNKKKNGELYWEMASISPLIDEHGKITHFVAVKEDITDRKLMEAELIMEKEKAEEMNRLKSNFLANMSHELRTPMIGILGYSELLKDQAKDLEVRQSADIIFQSGTRLMETLNLILNLSRIEAGKLEINLTNVNIVKVAHEVCQLFQESAHKKSLRLQLMTQANTLFVSLDETMFRQVITNLVNNAIKFTSQGEVRIEIQKLSEINAEYAVIKIIDSGIGISKESLPIIWEEFRQVSEGRSRGFEGTGLGLSITKKFVQKLKGEIYVESEVEKGTTFTVRFPVVQVAEVPEQFDLLKHARAIKRPMKVTDDTKPTILYVDDDSIAVALAGILLKPYCNIDRAKNSSEAIQKAKEKCYAAILMDINLGRGATDGVQTTKLIRELPHYKQVPIVAVTAYAMDGDREEFLSAGCSHYLSKPFSNEQLVELIQELVHSSETAKI